MARISTTPGKTRAMNVYVVGRLSSVVGENRKPSTEDALYLLDLPGYGYARASQPERAAFARLVRHVLRRPRLAGVVWLLDARHEPSAGDRAMQDLLAAARTPVLAAVTKSDKLPRGRRRERARALQAALALDEDQLIATSARTGDGIPELREAIAALAR
jgi:GTP-binding protein